MNVGSILNGDSPPENEEKKSGDEQPSIQTIHQRHSINNLLNDAPVFAARSESGNKQSSLANLTNEESDEDDTTDEEINVDFRRNVLDEPPHPVTVVESPKVEPKEPKGKPKAKPKEREPKAEVKVPRIPSKDTTSPSIKNSVNSELATIKLFKSSKGKPKRYSAPPIWAQEWVPPSQQRENGFREAPVAVPEPNGNISEKHIFNRTLMYSVDLECLITGVIPPPSVVRTVAEWIYANFVEIPLENRQFVELELKFGTIMDKAAGKRLDLNVSTECIFTKSSAIHFDMGVHEVGWHDMQTFLEELEKLYQDENRKNSQKPKRKFNTLETDMTDLFFQINERNEKPKTIRISKDNTLNPPRYVGIQKKRISDLYIHNPLSMYDLRLSLSFEFPIAEGSVDPVMKRNKPTLQRGKKRCSWTHTPTATQFDLTKVQIPKTMKNKLGKVVVENETSFEVELEIDTVEIFKGFDKIRDGSDTIRFEELVEVFLNNARCLNNRVTKLASK